ncbi:MAG TPA: efflux RND transporter permease subunit [Candidatus Baltobacteraceae bacterium]|jgi:multidrug efflux pump subunit AcrB|nr:efflux RND transporter permease subunit [Candidatus Baltobacteraceae bacterium]
MWLTRFAITRPVITAMVFIALAIFGIIAFNQIGRSQDPPGTAFPIVVVYAGYSGASPQEMERLIVKPIEDQLDGIDNLDQLNATAQEGTATIVVQFKLGTDLDKAAINVQSAVDTARVYLPTDLDPPEVSKNGASEPLLDIAVSSKSLSETELADVVNNRLEPILKGIPNIQTVDVYGAQSREFHVEPIPARLLGTNATMGDVFAAVAANNSNLPGGILHGSTQETSVSVHAEVNSAQDLAGIPLPVTRNADKNLKIGDVANSYDSHVEPTAISHYNGQPRVYVELSRNINSDEIKSTQIARAAMKKIALQFPELTFNEIDAPADYTQKSLAGVWQSLLEGIVLTMVVMLLFLHAWRNSVVVMISIPTSILSTFVLMNLFGFHFDFMSTMGLSLIIGILVDDSIVVLENITRHRDLGEGPFDAAINGRSEIGGAAVAITMVDVVVFLPVAFLPGIVGAYLREFGAVIVIATLFSLLVSFTLTPLLAAKWSVLERSTAPPRWMTAMNSWKTQIQLLVVAAVLAVIPWPLPELRAILPIMIVAVLLLNAVVQRYDAIVNWYKSRALPYALENGSFVVFVCGVLVINALTLAAGAGMATVVINGIILVLCAIWHGLGFVLRRNVSPARLNYVASKPMNGHSRLTRLWEKICDAGMNGIIVIGRWFSATGTNLRLTAITFAIPVALTLAFVALGPISFDFVPNVQTGAINMTVTYPAGTPLTTTEKFVSQLEDGIMKIDGIKSVSSTVGRKPQGWGSAIGSNYARVNAETLDSRRGDTYKIIDEIRKLAYLVPGSDFQVSGDNGGGSGAQIFYSLSGPEDAIVPAADKVARYLRDTPGSVNVQTSNESSAPRLNVNVDPQKAEVLGISPGDAALAARLAIDGAVATKVRTENGLVDVRVQLPRAMRSTVDELRAARVRAQDGTLVPLSDIATFQMTTAPQQIKDLNRQRVVDVYGAVLPSYSLGAVTAPLEKALKEPGFLPAGVQLTAQGDTQYMNETMANMGLALLLSFMLVYMLMVILYSSFVEPLIVMMSVPLAAIGALVALALMHRIEPNAGQSLNLMSMIGIIMLFGLVAKNGILLVDYSNTLCKRGMRVREAVLQAAGTRFRPILMTTCAMIFGMLPLALGFAEGGEWRQAMGTVIIGGLASSLILTLFLVPMIYNTWIGFFERRADQRALAAEMSHPAAQRA